MPQSDYVALEVLFAFNSADLTDEARDTLNRLGEALTSPELKGYCFVIEGHTDSVGSDAYNQRLSELRARSTVGYLTKKFPVIGPDQLIAVGYGESKPFKDNDTEMGRSLNRRVQVASLSKAGGQEAEKFKPGIVRGGPKPRPELIVDTLKID